MCSRVRSTSFAEKVHKLSGNRVISFGFTSERFLDFGCLNLAAFDAPLVKAVYPPEAASQKCAVLVECDQSAKRMRIECLTCQDQRWLATWHDLLLSDNRIEVWLFRGNFLFASTIRKHFGLSKCVSDERAGSILFPARI